jgi:hypothetical protein
MELSERELATTLAALRFWQRAMERDGGERSEVQREWAYQAMPHFEDVGALDAEEINELCERLNS